MAQSQAKIHDAVPHAVFADADAFLRSAAGLPVTEVLQEGGPWGALHEMAMGGARLADSQVRDG